MNFWRTFSSLIRASVKRNKNKNMYMSYGPRCGLNRCFVMSDKCEREEFQKAQRFFVCVNFGSVLKDKAEASTHGGKNGQRRPRFQRCRDYNLLGFPYFCAFLLLLCSVSHVTISYCVYTGGVLIRLICHSSFGKQLMIRS